MPIRKSWMNAICAFSWSCSSASRDPVQEARPDEAGAPAPDSAVAAPSSSAVVDPSTGLPIALCGMAPYELLPAEEVGRVVSADQQPYFSLNLAEPTPSGVADAPAYRFRYTTQDRGRRVEATAMLSFPTGTLDVSALPIAVFLHPTAGWTDPCATTAQPPDNPMVSAASQYAMAGVIAVAPDYIGMAGFGGGSQTRHAYFVGEQAAIGVWDAVRAAERLLEDMGTGIGSNRRVMLFGWSQGGHAALFTERYGPYYAPEYDVASVVATVPRADLRAWTVDLAHASPYLPAVYVAQREWYGAPPDLMGVFTNDAPNYFAERAFDGIYQDGCAAGQLFAEHTAEDILDPGLLERWHADADSVAPWSCYFRENSIATTSVTARKQAPTLILAGSDDDWVPPEALRQAVREACDAGLDYRYLECQGADHINAFLWSSLDAYGWANSMLSGNVDFSPAPCELPEPVCCRGTPADVCTP